MNIQTEVEQDFRRELENIPVFSRNYNNGGLLTLVVGKTESSGDWGHGGRTYIKLQDESCLDILLCVTDIQGKKYYFNKQEWNTIEFLAGGEWERDILSKSLSDVGHYLKNENAEIE